MMAIVISIVLMIPSCMLGGWWVSALGLMMLSFYIMSFLWAVDYASSLSYSLSQDLLSWVFNLLSMWILFLVILASFCVMSNTSEFSVMSCVLSLSLLSAFSALNMLMFYMMFELSIIPTLFLIFGWGYDPERLVAGFYLLFYTLFVSFPLLLGLFYVYEESFTLCYFMILFNCGVYSYFALVGAFLIKMPVFMFHFCLLKAHVEAPVSGSMVLAGVLLSLVGGGMN